MVQYPVVVEKTKRNFSAYSPDLPGCIATGETHDEVIRNMQSAVEMHLARMAEDHLPAPLPRSSAEYVTVRAF